MKIWIKNHLFPRVGIKPTPVVQLQSYPAPRRQRKSKKIYKKKKTFSLYPGRPGIYQVDARNLTTEMLYCHRIGTRVYVLVKLHLRKAFVWSC